MGDYRGRLPDTPGTPDLFRRASSDLYSHRVDAHCLAGIKFDLLFDPQILLSRIGIPACPFMIETSHVSGNSDRQECLSHLRSFYYAGV